MISWRECKLGDLITHKKGFAFKSNDFKPEGHRVVKVKDFTSNSIDISKCEFLDESISNQFYDYRLKENDIIIATVGSWPSNPASIVGKVVKVPKMAENSLLNQNAVRLRGSDLINQVYLYYKLKTTEFADYLISGAQGSANQASITLNDVFNYSFELPPLEEQKAIAEVLCSLDDKIDLLHRQNHTLESLAGTLFKQWFIEEAKEEWEEKPLKDICEIINGFAFKSGDYRENGRTIIRTMNFKNGFINNSDVVYIDIQEEIKYTKYQLQKNDFLLVMVGASLGNFAIVTNDILPALQNQNMWNFRTLGNVSQHYLNFAMRQIVEENISSASGSAREFFQKGQFYQFMITVPDNETMQLFNDNIEDFYSKIENDRLQIQTLENLRDTLLPKLLSGGVRVEI